MSLAEWMKLVAESSAEHLPYEAVVEQPEHSRTTPETKTWTIEWREVDNEASKEEQRT